MEPQTPHDALPSDGKGSNSDRRIASGTVVIAIFTVVLALVSLFQGYELLTSKSDTDRLLASLETQAKAQKVAAEQSRSQALSLIQVANQATLQAAAAQRYATIAKDQAATLLLQAKAAQIQNELALRPIVAIRTQTIIEGTSHQDYIVIHNAGFGPALNVVTNTMEAKPIVFKHRILLSVGQEERVSISEGDQVWTTQEQLTQALKRLKSLTICIAYANAVGRPYYTWQRLYILPSEKDFGIDVLSKSTPCK